MPSTSPYHLIAIIIRVKEPEIGSKYKQLSLIINDGCEQMRKHKISKSGDKARSWWNEQESLIKTMAKKENGNGGD